MGSFFRHGEKEGRGYFSETSSILPTGSLPQQPGLSDASSGKEVI